MTLSSAIHHKYYNIHTAPDGRVPVYKQRTSETIHFQLLPIVILEIQLKVLLNPQP